MGPLGAYAREHRGPGTAGGGVLRASVLTPSVRIAEEVSQNLLEDVDDFPGKYIVFCQKFSESKGDAGMNV